MATIDTDIAIIGAGSVGIAVAFYLKQFKPELRVVLIDEAQPMALTSAASGENYRNWWPHPVMKQFMERSIELFSDLNKQANREIVVSSNGYLLATREAQPADLLDNLQQTFSDDGELRHHSHATSYQNAISDSSTGIDILQSGEQISRCFNDFDKSVQTLVHIRQGGSISAHHLGSFMLRQFKTGGGVFHTGSVRQIEKLQNFRIHTDTDTTPGQINAEVVVNAAGPFSQLISSMLGVALPIENTLQQKIAFADEHSAIDRQLPFTIDLDPQTINWSDDEREAIAQDESLAKFAHPMPGSIHCRPDGGINGKRIKLGWAYNSDTSEPMRNPPLDDHFPEIVLRGASRLHNALSTYTNGFPRDFTHYGGYYTLTRENWPLMGATDLPGYFIATAMSGFGSMAACAAGELTALSVIGKHVPDYAAALSLQRYQDHHLMQEINSLQSKGIL